MNTDQLNFSFNAACPLDAPTTSGCEAEHPCKAAPLFCKISAKEAKPLLSKYHYAGDRVPNAVRYDFGLKFGGEIVAAILFGEASARWEGSPVIELLRLVKHPDFVFPLSKFISMSLHEVKITHDLVVSYADPSHNHHGGVYQAYGFNYGGQGCIDPPGRPEKKQHFQSLIDGFFIDGEFVPRRSCNAKYGTSSYPGLMALLPNSLVVPRRVVNKHLYWKAIRRSGNKKAEILGMKILPYPKPNLKT